MTERGPKHRGDMATLIGVAVILAIGVVFGLAWLFGWVLAP